MTSGQNQGAVATTRVSAPAISDGGIMVKRSMIPIRHSSSSAAMTTQTKPSWRMRTRTITRPAPPSPSERAAQVFVKQALIDQLAPVERLLKLADGDEAVDDGGQSFLGEVAAAPKLPLVVFRQDSIGLRKRYLPHLSIDARRLLAVVVDELDRLAMDLEYLAQGRRILRRELLGRHRNLPGEFRIILVAIEQYFVFVRRDGERRIV